MSILDDIDRMEKLTGQSDLEKSSVTQRQLSNDDIDAAFADFNNSVIDNTSQPTERTALGTLADIGLSGASGIVSAGEAAVGLSNIPTFGYAGKGLETIGYDPKGLHKLISSGYSEPQKAANEQVENAEGFIDTTSAMIKNPSTIGHAVVESLPSSIGGGYIGKGLLKAGTTYLPKAINAMGKYAPTIAAAVGEGIIGAGSSAEQTRQNTKSGTLTGKQVALSSASGFGTGAFALAGGSVAKKLGFADLDTMIASGNFKKSSDGIIKNIIGGGISEGMFEELPQSAQEQIFANAALDKPLMEDVGKSIATGLLTGFATGGTANAITTGKKQKDLSEDEKQLNKQVDNIFSFGEEKVNTTLQTLQDNVAKNSELLNNQDALDKYAMDANIDPDTLIKQLVDDNNRNDSLIKGIQKRLTEQQLTKDQEIANLSPEQKQVLDAQNRINDQREEAALNINEQLNVINEQLRTLRQQAAQEQDVEKRNLLYENVFGLIDNRDALLDKQKQVVATTEFTEPKKADEIRNEKEAFYQQLWPGGVDKDAVESAQVFNEKSPEQQDILDRITTQIANTQDVQKKQELQKVYDGLFQTFERDANEAAKVFESNVTTLDQQEADRKQREGEQYYNEVFAQNQDQVNPNVNNEVTTQSAEESAKTFEQAGLANGQTSAFTDERQVELTDNQQIIVDKNNFEIAKLKQSYNTTVDRAERINILNQIDELEKVNAGIRTPAENFPQFQITNQETLGKVGIEDIKKAFPKQTISQAEDGTISVQFKNGKGLTINSIQQADKEFIKLAIETGQMSKNGKILGITVGNEILLNENFADNKTLWHENKHVLDNLGLITADDDAALNREFNKLRKAGKLEFELSTHKDPKQAMIENRANMFAQVMVNRDAYRSTGFGKVIQRVMDFFQQLLSFGKQSVAGLARAVESGKFYERQGNDKNNEVNFTTDENSTPEQIIQEVNPAVKYDGLMKGIPGVIEDLHNFTITLPDGKQPSFSITGKVTSEKLAEQLNKVLDKFDNQFKSVDPNSPNLRKWLGSSKITTPVYHGSPTEFWTFNKDMTGQNTNQARTGLGFFFTQDKTESAGYAGPGGFNRAFYLKIENPKIMNASELPKLRNTEEANAFANRMKLAGHDGIYLKDEGHWIAFDAWQIKSAEINTGEFSTNNKDVRFQVDEETGQKITDETYAQMFNERNNLVRKIGQILRMRGTEFKQLLDKGFGSISTRLKNVDPMLAAEIRNLDFRTSQKIVSALRIAHPLLEATKKISPKDKFVWDAARRNSDEGKIKQIAEKYGILEAQENLRNVLNQIRQDAIDVGYDVGFIDEYWPRIIKDQEGFLQATKGISNQPVFTNALKMQADKLGLSVEKFQTEYPEVAADIISNTILGRNLGIGGPGNIQARQYDTVPPELNKYYMDSDAALMQYIYSMTKKIEVRRFFGKVPERISELKADRKRKDGQILTYNEMWKTATPENKAELNKRIEEVSDDLVRIEQELDKYKLQRDYTENIGAYIDDLILTGRISKDEEKIVRNILDARFHEHGTTGLVNAYKNIAYIDVMGSPISALTQIGDLAWAMYVGKVWTPRGLSNTVKNISKAATKNSEITKEDLGIERIAQEFADGTTLGNAVSWVFKKVGLEKMDSIGKETLINNALDNYKAMVQTEDGRTSLTKYLKPIFGSESAGVIQDLVANNHSDNVKMLLYHRLLDFQPVALSEMPEQYLKSGNGRIFYMLKTYTLKQFDVFRNEAWHKIKTGERDHIIEGIGNMIKLTSLLALANAGADELKDLLLGKDVKFKDHVIENFITMSGASRYVKMQIKQDGLGAGLIRQILPPFKFIDALSKDVAELRDQQVAGDILDFNQTRIVESLPIGGKLYYWHYGRGEDYKKSSNEQSFKDVGKEVDMFKRQLENADNKREFMYANIDKFKQMKLHENFQSALSRNQAVINKLKKVPETTNVIERLGKLKEQREVLLDRYFEASKGLNTSN